MRRSSKCKPYAGLEVSSKQYLYSPRTDQHSVPRSSDAILSLPTPPLSTPMRFFLPLPLPTFLFDLLFFLVFPRRPRRQDQALQKLVLLLQFGNPVLQPLQLLSLLSTLSLQTLFPLLLLRSEPRTRGCISQSLQFGFVLGESGARRGGRVGVAL